MGAGMARNALGGVQVPPSANVSSWWLLHVPETHLPSSLNAQKVGDAPFLYGITGNTMCNLLPSFFLDSLYQNITLRMYIQNASFTLRCKMQLLHM